MQDMRGGGRGGQRGVEGVPAWASESLGRKVRAVDGAGRYGPGGKRCYFLPVVDPPIQGVAELLPAPRVVFPTIHFPQRQRLQRRTGHDLLAPPSAHLVTVQAIFSHLPCSSSSTSSNTAARENKPGFAVQGAAPRLSLPATASTPPRARVCYVRIVFVFSAACSSSTPRSRLALAGMVPLSTAAATFRKPTVDGFLVVGAARQPFFLSFALVKVAAMSPTWTTTASTRAPGLTRTALSTPVVRGTFTIRVEPLLREVPLPDATCLIWQLWGVVRGGSGTVSCDSCAPPRWRH